MERSSPIPVLRLVLVPALITLGVTVLRLVGELLDWAPALFGKEAGGGGSLIGISWLVPVFGIYFGIRLARLGVVPASSWRAVGAALGGLAVVIVTVVIVGSLNLAPIAQLAVGGTAALVGAWIATLGWPDFGRVLGAYGLAARIPVIIVSLAAILGRWGTHYDVLTPEFSHMDAWNPMLKWLAIAVVPQLTAWIGFTIIFGMLFGVPAAAIARRRSTQSTHGGTEAIGAQGL